MFIYLLWMITENDADFVVVTVQSFITEALVSICVVTLTDCRHSDHHCGQGF